MVGFINAVGINIVLGQLDNFTGYEAQGANRVLRAFDTLLNLGKASWPTIAVGVTTIVLILLLERTKLGALGMVVAIIAGSAIAPVLGWDVAVLNDIAEIPKSLPLPMMPDFGAIPVLLVPALSLAFIGLVQGAGISANFPNADGSYPDAARDFVGQGAANVAAGIFQGMPVGGSMSGTSLVKNAGAKSRLALLIAGVIMAIVILIFGSAVGYIAMPALAGLLMVVGFRTVKPADIKAVWKTGGMQATVMGVTFVLTMLIPLQYAVLVGVGISMILFIINQSNQIVIKRWLIDADGDLREVDAPTDVPADEVIVLQPYGSLFFASAPVFEEQLPNVTDETHNSVVVLRLRGRSDLGSTFMDVLLHYAEALRIQKSKLMLVSADKDMHSQLEVARVTDAVGSQNIYTSDEWVGRTLKQAYADATEWVADHERDGDETPSPESGDDETPSSPESVDD